MIYDQLGNTWGGHDFAMKIIDHRSRVLHDFNLCMKREGFWNYSSHICIQKHYVETLTHDESSYQNMFFFFKFKYIVVVDLIAICLLCTSIPVKYWSEKEKLPRLIKTSYAP